jgi:hypothetical protein
MKTSLTVIITVIVVVGVLILIGANLQGSPANQERTISVLSQPAPYSNFSEYYLYVPGGGHSTCTWTYVQSSTPDSISTQPDPQTGQHDFLTLPSVSNVAVTCLNDQGIKYIGQF